MEKKKTDRAIVRGLCDAETDSRPLGDWFDEQGLQHIAGAIRRHDGNQAISYAAAIAYCLEYDDYPAAIAVATLAGADDLAWVLSYNLRSDNWRALRAARETFLVVEPVSTQLGDSRAGRALREWSQLCRGQAPHGMATRSGFGLVGFDNRRPAAR